jgi:hypothetical protein
VENQWGKKDLPILKPFGRVAIMSEQQPEKRPFEDTQREFYHATYDLLKSIESKVNIIFWVFFITLIVQILVALRIL